MISMNRISLLLLAALIGLAGCTEKADKVYLPPYKPDKPIVDDDIDAEYFDPRADILFVIDDSVSMDDHQNNLVQNINKFTEVFLQKSVLDYNIGVISTDNDGSKNPCCGRLYGGVTTVVNKRTPNAEIVLKRNLYIGTGGSGYERPFDTTVLAFSPQRLANENRDFYRPDASLIIVFITDAEDQSRVYPTDLYTSLLTMKGGDDKKVMAYGAIIPTTERNCTRDDPGATPRRIEQFLDMVSNKGNNVLNLCDPGFGERLAAFATEIVEKTSSMIYLSRAPQPDTIVVTYGDVPLPSDPNVGWTFSPIDNTIRLGAQIDWKAQPVGSKIKVSYKALTYED